MNFQLDSVIEILLSADNQRRSEAEKYLQEMTANSFEEAVESFLAVMNHENANVFLLPPRWPPWEPSSSRRSTSTPRTPSPSSPKTS